MKVRKKPVVVEAYHLKDLSYESVTECLNFIGQPMRIPRCFPEYDNPFDDYMIIVWKNNSIVIHTLDGDHLAKAGDYIIRGIQGELYLCKPDIFMETYEVIEDDHSM